MECIIKTIIDHPFKTAFVVFVLEDIIETLVNLNREDDEKIHIIPPVSVNVNLGGKNNS